MQLLKETLDAEIETEIVFDVGIIYSLFKCFAMFTHRAVVACVPRPPARIRRKSAVYC